MRTALVAGARGIVGGALVDRLLESGWSVVGLSRTASGRPEPLYRHLACDLSDTDACSVAARSLSGVTHVFYTARASDPSPEAECHLNASMLRNIMEAILGNCPDLRHACLVHGTKWYGSHLGPFRTPATEDDPRHDGQNWYFDQHEYISRRQAGMRWTFSTVRPHIVCGVSVGYPFNGVSTIAIYATLCREMGLPLDFPGTEAAFNAVTQATDARLLADAMIWTTDAAAARNADFNVINADYFRWCNLWPRLADAFGIRCGGPGGTSLRTLMNNAEPIWQALVRRENLKPNALSALANWGFGDFLFRTDWDSMSSTLKIRKAGFHNAIGTEESILRIIQTMKSEGLIP